ncbi:hypothetical protein AGMMS50256_18420 [Betaproteobacteria bacterium]|nr:hypothetical protein AGMMS50256_18420 [Betaproteobacteria bacterium]
MPNLIENQAHITWITWVRETGPGLALQFNTAIFGKDGDDDWAAVDARTRAKMISDLDRFQAA